MRVAVLAALLVLAIAATAATASAQAPSNTAPPSVSGTAQVAKTLTASPGTWSGEQPMTFTYRWQRCPDGVQDACANVDETADRFTTLPVDQADKLRVLVTARNAAAPDGVTAPSAMTAFITSSPGNVPTASSAAAIGPTDEPRPAGTVFTAGSRSWSNGGSTSAHRWYRCAGEDPLSCQWISDAAASSYASRDADARRTLRVKMVGSNASADGLVVSAFTPELLLATPVSQQPPAIVGDPFVGDTLTGSLGTWSGSELAFASQWEVCDDLLDRCDAIPGATAPTFVVPSSAIGRRLRRSVVASNGAHPTYSQRSATSTQTAPVSERPATPAAPVTPAAPPAAGPPPPPPPPATGPVALMTATASKPAALAAPRLSGTARVGRRLRCAPGRWSGGARLAYQWLRNGRAIGRATRSAYSLTRRDRGRRVACRVRATNAAGTTVATTPAKRVR